MNTSGTRVRTLRTKSNNTDEMMKLHTSQAQISLPSTALRQPSSHSTAELRKQKKPNLQFPSECQHNGGTHF